MCEVGVGAPVSQQAPAVAVIAHSPHVLYRLFRKSGTHTASDTPPSGCVFLSEKMNEGFYSDVLTMPT